MGLEFSFVLRTVRERGVLSHIHHAYCDEACRHQVQQTYSELPAREEHRTPNRRKVHHLVNLVSSYQVVSMASSPGVVSRMNSSQVIGGTPQGAPHQYP